MYICICIFICIFLLVSELVLWYFSGICFQIFYSFSYIFIFPKVQVIQDFAYQNLLIHVTWPYIFIPSWKIKLHQTTIPPSLHVQWIRYFSEAAQVGMSKILPCWVTEYDGTSKFKPWGYRCTDNLLNHVDISWVGFEPTPSLKTRILLLLLLKQGVYPWVCRLWPLSHPDDENLVLINKDTGRVLLINPRYSFPSILAIKIR